MTIHKRVPLVRAPDRGLTMRRYTNHAPLHQIFHLQLGHAALP